MMEDFFDKSGRYLDSVKRHFDQQEKKLDESMEMVDDHVASLEQDARQRRLSMEADGAADIKTHERTEGAATAVQAMHGDSCSANRVHLDPMCSTSFGDDGTGPPAFPCSREKTLVNNGATAPKSCISSLISPLEIRAPTAVGGLLPTGKTSTATKTTFDHPTLWFYLTEETNLRTLILYISYFSSFGWINNRKPPSGRRSSKQNRGKIGCLILAVLGRLRACPFLGTWCALLCGEVNIRTGWGCSVSF